MPSGDQDSGLRHAAAAALNESLETLLADEANRDLTAILPPTFVDDLLKLAWSHQSDLDKARFRRGVRRYLQSIASQVGTPPS